MCSTADGTEAARARAGLFTRLLFLAHRPRPGSLHRRHCRHLPSVSKGRASELFHVQRSSVAGLKTPTLPTPTRPQAPTPEQTNHWLQAPRFAFPISDCRCSVPWTAPVLVPCPSALRVWSAVPSQKRAWSSQARLCRLLHSRHVRASELSQRFPASTASSLQLVVLTRMAQLSACFLLSSQSVQQHKFRNQVLSTGVQCSGVPEAQLQRKCWLGVRSRHSFRVAWQHRPSSCVMARTVPQVEDPPRGRCAPGTKER